MKKLLYAVFEWFFSGPSLKNVPEQNTSLKSIELTLTRFVPEPLSMSNTVASTGEALAWLDLATDSDCIVEASARWGTFSLGDFILWCSGEFACARIGEHRGHNARHLDSAFAVPDTVTFKDDDGSIYVPPRELILPRQLATDALRAWLIDQEHPSMLRWD
jgi:hypothetical protein